MVRDDTRGVNEKFDSVDMSLAWPSISKSFGVTGRLNWHGDVVDVALTLADFAEALIGNRSGVKLRLAGPIGKFAFDGSLSTQPTLKVTGNLAADTSSLRQAMRWSRSEAAAGRRLRALCAQGRRPTLSAARSRSPPSIWRWTATWSKAC